MSSAEDARSLTNGPEWQIEPSVCGTVDYPERSPGKRVSMTVPLLAIACAWIRYSRQGAAVSVCAALPLAGCAWTPAGEPLTVERYRAEQAARADEREARVAALLESELEPLAAQEERLRRVEARTSTILTELRQLEVQLRASPRQLANASAEASPADNKGSDGDGGPEGEAGTEANGEPDITREPGVINGGEPITFGAVECVALPELDLVLRARVDSGAVTASLNAVDIQEFERDGDAWVRFRIPRDTGDRASGAGGNDGEENSGGAISLFDGFLETVELPGNSEAAEQGAVTVEAEVDRRVRIIQSVGEESRPVVRLPARIGPLERPIEFTLADRRNLEFPALIGRRVLRDIAVIDVGREFVHPCQPE